jgi:hypothetical protein
MDNLQIDDPFNNMCSKIVTVVLVLPGLIEFLYDLAYFGVFAFYAKMKCFYFLIWIWIWILGAFFFFCGILSCFYFFFRIWIWNFFFFFCWMPLPLGR